MWETSFKSPMGSLHTKVAPFGERYHGPSPILPAGAALGAPSLEFEHTKTYPAGARCGIRGGRIPCSRDMSPICSDTTETDEPGCTSWANPEGPLMTTPASPPPPPQEPPEAFERVSAYLSRNCTTQRWSAQHQQRQPTILLPHSASPVLSAGDLAVPANKEESCAPPTPPWRKRRSTPDSRLANIFQGTRHVVLATSRLEHQQQQQQQLPHTMLFEGGPEDPYALAPSHDPYASKTCSNGSNNCYSAPLSAPQMLQQINAAAEAAASVAVAAAVASRTGTSNGMPLLLPPPIASEGPPPPPGSLGLPHCAPYQYRGAAATAAAAKGGAGPWRPPEALRIRQRFRARQRREGTLPQKTPGGPLPLPLPPHCYYPLQQQQLQQPDRALLALRRICYRCRRRGHEASECHSGQAPRQMGAAG